MLGKGPSQEVSVSIVIIWTQGGGCGSIERESGVQTKDNEEEEKEDRRWF